MSCTPCWVVWLSRIPCWCVAPVPYPSPCWVVWLPWPTSCCVAPVPYPPLCCVAPVPYPPLCCVAPVPYPPLCCVAPVPYPLPCCVVPELYSPCERVPEEAPEPRVVASWAKALPEVALLNYCISSCCCRRTSIGYSPLVEVVARACVMVASMVATGEAGRA